MRGGRLRAEAMREASWEASQAICERGGRGRRPPRHPHAPATMTLDALQGRRSACVAMAQPDLPAGRAAEAGSGPAHAQVVGRHESSGRPLGHQALSRYGVSASYLDRGSRPAAQRRGSRVRLREGMSCLSRWAVFPRHAAIGVISRPELAEARQPPRARLHRRTRSVDRAVVRPIELAVTTSR